MLTKEQIHVLYMKCIPCPALDDIICSHFEAIDNIHADQTRRSVENGTEWLTMMVSAYNEKQQCVKCGNTGSLLTAFCVELVQPRCESDTYIRGYTNKSAHELLLVKCSCQHAWWIFPLDIDKGVSK